MFCTRIAGQPREHAPAVIQVRPPAEETRAGSRVIDEGLLVLDKVVVGIVPGVPPRNCGNPSYLTVNTQVSHSGTS